jgi:hypothetical protein
MTPKELDALVAYARETWPLVPSAGPITSKQRETVHGLCDGIATLQERVRVLEEALRPFAETCEDCVDDDDPDQRSIWEDGAAMQIEFRHLRSARAALNTSEKRDAPPPTEKRG